jgi:SNF2 family DNA or RNA helicase
MERAKGLPGRKKFVDRVMHFELTDDNVSHAKSAFPMAEVIEPVSDKSNLVNGPRRPFATAMEPKALQAEAFSLSRGKKMFAFFEKPGAGKTKMILDWAVDMWCAGEIDGLFVFSYATVHEQWVKDEIPKHVHPSMPIQAEYWKSGKKNDRSILHPDKDKLRILTMNFESYAVSDKAFKFAKEFSRSGCIAAAVDESHRLKSPESQIGIKAVDHRNDWGARIIASGEPTPLGVQDYYQQFCFLDPAIIGAWTYTAFRSMYCRMGGFQQTKIVGYQNQENLHRLMAPYVHVGAPDIDAEKLYEASKFDLGPKARAAYRQMLNELIVDIDGNRFHSVRSVLPKLMKLEEITCGRITNRRGEVEYFEDNRNELLKTLLEVNGNNKAIVWSRFKSDHEKQKEMLGDKAAVFNGDTPKALRHEIVQRFKDKGDDLQYLLASTGAAGTGLNLQGSCWLNIYHSNSANAGQRWQSEMRTFRIGTDRDVRYIDIVARATTNVGILNNLRRKREVSDMSIAEFRDLLDEQQLIEEWEQ